MINLNPSSWESQITVLRPTLNPHACHGLAVRAALDLHRRTCRQSLGKRLWCRLFKGPGELLDLAAIEQEYTIGARCDEGLRAVPLERIRGSIGRCRDFDARFHPVQRHTRDRWVQVAIAMQRGEGLPPVDLIRVGDIYFVCDGHHRVSVARALGQQFVDARVTAWQLVSTRSAAPSPAGCSNEALPARPVRESL